jgi:hypothetical protein
LHRDLLRRTLAAVPPHPMLEHIGSEWMRLETLICAHRRKRARDERLGNWLSWGTIVGAFATGATGVSGAAAAAAQRSPWLTVLLGVLTAAIAGLTAAIAASEKVFTPTKNLRSLWKTETGLDTAKHELITLSLQLKEIATPADAMKVLNQISENANKAIDVPISENENDRLEADRAFKRSDLYRQLHEIAVDLQEPGNVVIADDAFGVIRRGRR